MTIKLYSNRSFKLLETLNAEVIPRVGDEVVTNKYHGCVSSVVYRFDKKYVEINGSFKEIIK